MKYTTAIISSLMAATAVAQPRLRHQHGGRHAKREVVWYTEVDMVTETVDYTTTVWVPAGGLPAPSTSVPSFTPTTFATIPTSAVPASSSAEGAVFNQAIRSSRSFSRSSFVAPSSSTEAAPVVVVPTTSSSAVVVVPTTSTSSPVAVPTTSSASSPVVVPTTSATSSYVAPAATSSVPATTTASSPSSVSTCASGSPCTGDITYYDAGLGACGLNTDGNSVQGVALPFGLMGTLSNDNPYCGKTITITCIATGKTTTATVVDKCMGCVGDSIDLTKLAFDQLEDEAVGRTQATWHFND
ncbi:hypothetical protein NHQ30_008854 [Ciborinia camelliae]|nr:hypothetical protein NHQ30_008854 [Ciborinia camelliae]